MSQFAVFGLGLGAYLTGAYSSYRYLQERTIRKIESEADSPFGLDPCDRADIRIRVLEESSTFVGPALLWPAGVLPMFIRDKLTSY